MNSHSSPVNLPLTIEKEGLSVFYSPLGNTVEKKVSIAILFLMAISGTAMDTRTFFPTL
jgi:hypothetical protein